jgi:hypothetical protein
VQLLGNTCCETCKLLHCTTVVCMSPAHTASLLHRARMHNIRDACTTCAQAMRRCALWHLGQRLHASRWTAKGPATAHIHTQCETHQHHARKQTERFRMPAAEAQDVIRGNGVAASHKTPHPSHSSGLIAPNPTTAPKRGLVGVPLFLLHSRFIAASWKHVAWVSSCDNG